MKRFLLVVMILASAASLYAAELKVSGDANVRGLWDGVVPDKGDKTSCNYFDYDVNINAALVANENATVNVKLTYDKTVDGSGKVDMGSASAADAGLAVERAYINYKFFPFLQVNTGLMGGGQWASTFGDKEINVMRVQGIGALSEDMIFILTYEKQAEGGKQLVKDTEKEDTTACMASAKLKFGPVTVLPLFVYGWRGFNNATDRKSVV